MGNQELFQRCLHIFRGWGRVFYPKGCNDAEEGNKEEKELKEKKSCIYNWHQICVSHASGPW